MKSKIDTKQLIIDIIKSFIISLFISIVMLLDYYVEERYKLNSTVYNKSFKCFILTFIITQIIFYFIHRLIPGFSNIILNCFKNNNKNKFKINSFSIIKFYTYLKENFVTIVVFLFAIFMMLFNLMHSPLFGDEWIEYSISQQSIFNGQLFRSCGNTFQPPLYNIIMHFWLLISKDLLWFRLFNVLISIFSLIYFFKAVKLLYDAIVANISIIALSVVYNWIYTVQECSEYCLMLHFNFASIYFFVKAIKSRNIWWTVFFILNSVLAIYSQYGAALFISPLLIMFAIREVFYIKEKNRTIFLIYSYILCLIFFAYPLYVIFLKRQLAGNAIVENALTFNLIYLKDLIFAFGQIIGYFTGTRDTYYFVNFWSLFSIVLIVLTVALILSKIVFLKKLFLISVLISYLIYYTLVKMQIYGMVHANQSAGLYSRYSIYLMPIYTISCIIIFKDAKDIIVGNRFISIVLYNIFVCIFAFLFFSLNITLRNWEKTKDFEMIRIYKEEKGYNDDLTFLIGEGTLGYTHYTKDLNPKYLKVYYNIDRIEVNNLPNRFWFYRTDWSDICYEDLKLKIDEIKN